MTVRRERFAVVALTAMLGATVALAAPAGRSVDAPSAAPRQTIDPQPPMALAVEVAGLEKQVRGGVASIVLRVSSEVPIDGAILTARTPGDLTFADGSRVKTWQVDLAAAGSREIPVAVLVPADGRYTITADVEGSLNGRAIRRGSAGNLEVGRRAAPKPSRDGAVEYLAVEAMTTEVQP